MKHSNEQKFDDELNIFEKKAKELFGADDESLLAEWEAAELEWEQEKLEHPEEARKIEMGADAGFEALMWRIEAERVEKGVEVEEEIEELPEDDELFGEELDDENLEIEETEDELFHEESEAGTSVNVGHNGKVPVVFDERCPTAENVMMFKHGKRICLRGRKKALLLVAAVCVMVLGMTMGVTATSKYKLRQYLIPDDQSKVVNRNANLSVIMEDRLEDVYKRIEKELDIPVLVLSGISKDMRFKRLFLEEDRAVIEFAYKGKSIYFEEARMPDSKGLASSIVSDRKVCQTVYNFWLNKEIAIEENVLKDGSTEYSARIELEESYYYFSGIMEKKEFIRLVEQISNW